MSRAFIKESDGWNYCRTRHIECSDAAFSGDCERSICKYPEERRLKEELRRGIVPEDKTAGS